MGNIISSVDNLSILNASYSERSTIQDKALNLENGNTLVKNKKNK